MPGGRVFRGPERGDRNVVLNFRHSPDLEFSFYGSAFHDAARTLVGDLKSRPGYSDLESLPIVFLYRHALELYLKAILIIGNQLLGIQGDEITETQLQRVLNSHRLIPFLAHLERILKGVGWVWSFEDVPELATFDDLRAVLTEIEGVDKDSFAFRYPTTKKGEGSVPHNFCFDLITFAALMDNLIGILDSAAGGLDAMYDTACEAFAEMQRNLE